MSKLTPIYIAVGVFVVLLGSGLYALNKFDAVTTANKDKYAKSYEAKALKEPFNLLSKQFQNNEWLYVYQTTTTTEFAFEQAKTQLTGGGYQIVQNRTDTKDTIYRDLITGGVRVKAVIKPTRSGQTGVEVTVTGIER